MGEFGTLGVMGAWKGIVLEDQGFGEIHRVADFFYPGVMSGISMVMVAEPLKKQVEERLDPEKVACLPECNAENWRQFAATALRVFGPTIDLDASRAAGR